MICLWNNSSKSNPLYKTDGWQECRFLCYSDAAVHVRVSGIILKILEFYLYLIIKIINFKWFLKLIRSSRDKQANKTTNPRMLRVTSAPLSAIGVVSRVSWVAVAAWTQIVIELCTWKLFGTVFKYIYIFCNYFIEFLQHSQHFFFH